LFFDISSLSKARMKILIISTNADEAGAPRHVESIVNGLRSEFQFNLIFGEDGPVSDRLKRGGCIVHVIKEMRTAINPANDLIAFIKIAKLIRAYQPDIVHCHSAKAGMLGRICAFLYRKKWLYTVHGWGWRGVTTFTKRLVIFIEKILSKLPRGFYIFVAQDVQNDALKVLKINPQQGVVIYNGVLSIDAALSDTKNSLVVMMPARVCSAKDQLSLILALESLNDSNVRLVLCGTGTDSPKFVELATKLAPNTHKFISFLGQRSDMPNIYSQCHVVALISNFEALPLSIIEAMSCSRAVIATSVGGIPELIKTGENGILVRPKSVSDIVEALKMCKDENVRLNLGKKARKTYDIKFAEKLMLTSVANTYHSLGKASK
jgi:glycosyltransferase involved in cell wall biosynthesis